jgi:hypothetical protein
MNLKKAALVIVTIIIIALVSVACSKSQVTTPAQIQNTATIQETGSSVQPTAVPTKASPTVPEDIPIMPDAYELQIPNQLNITYKVDLKIQDVVDFYEQTLPEDGWDQINNPDSVVGSMAQMTRSKTNGDRITFSLQYNPVGEFTIVQMYIIRAP